MRCEECGRPMKNAELWQLAGDPSAPTSSSMRHLCWECRSKAAAGASDTSNTPVIAEASEVIRRYEAHEA